MPGGQRALLTLADGRTIVLDSIANGQLALQNGVEIIKKQDGRLEYKANASMVESGNIIALNTMSTPAGEAISITITRWNKRLAQCYIFYHISYCIYW